MEHVTTLAEALDRLGGTRHPTWCCSTSACPTARGSATLGRVLEIASVPVVVLTGLDDDALAGTAVERGAQDYLVKGSVTGDTVGRAIRHAIERHRLAAALGERVKEMAGLAAINRTLLEDAAPDASCRQVAAHLAGAMQWPDVCHAEVDVDWPSVPPDPHWTPTPTRWSPTSRSAGASAAGSVSATRRPTVGSSCPRSSAWSTVRREPWPDGCDVTTPWSGSSGTRSASGSWSRTCRA